MLIELSLERQLNHLKHHLDGRLLAWLVSHVRIRKPILIDGRMKLSKRSEIIDTLCEFIGHSKGEMLNEYR
jgi:hypothetical protein